MSLKKLAIHLVVSVLLLILCVKAAKAAGPWYVDATSGNDTNDCLSAGSACLTIGAAIFQASAGDTINVAAGTYNEQVQISKTLTLLGAQHGVDARTRSATESIIDNACGPIQILADNVIVDGFTIQGATSSDPCLISGIWTNPGFSGTNGGYQILNNIIQNNIAGMEADNIAGHPATISKNLFLNNNLSGPGSGNGIETDFGLADTLIDNNKFVGNPSSSIVVEAPASGLTISNNEFDAGMALFNTVSSSVTSNKSANSPSSSTIDLAGGNDHVTISGNILLAGQRAIQVEDPYSVGANTNITAQNNCIQGNALAGFEADHLGYTGIITATSNWWGSSSGPSGSGPGTGDAIIDPDSLVDFSSFLTSPTICPAAPTITSAAGTTFTIGALGSFTVTTTGVPKPALTETGGLPNGVGLIDNGDGTGALSGTPGTGMAGTYNISFKASNGNNPDATQNFTLAVSKITTTISVSNIPGGAVYGGIFTPTYAYSGDGTPSVTSNTPSRCSVSGGVVNLVGGGTCTLVAHATGTTNYIASTGSPQSFTINPQTTTVSISNIPPSAAYLGSFTPAYIYTGNGKTSVTSSTPSYCTVSSSGVVSFVGVGTNVCTLTAHATATTNYTAVSGSPQQVTIGKANTTISIKNMPPPGTYKKSSSFTATYIYTGDGVSSVTSSTLSVCTVPVNSSVVTFVASGTCTLTAHATAGIKYNPATGNPQSSKITVK